jgi:hypothetical protein
MPGEPQPEGKVDTSNPWLVIPYFTGDQGRAGIERPLTGISWLCPSIKVNGVNYTSTPGSYIPDEPLSISVDVNNLGVPTAVVTVTVYWADPATGFANPAFVASTSFAVPGRSAAGPTTSPEMIWTPDHGSIPAHFCLLVQATTFPYPYPISNSPDPVGDRHWAQYNLQTISVPASKKFTSVLWAANPAGDAAVYTITARPVAREHLEAIARVVRAEPVAMAGGQIMIGRATAERPMVRSEHQHEMVVELEKGARHPLVVSGLVPELALHQFTAIEVIQSRLGMDRRDGVVTGSLGIVLFTEPER